MIARTPLAALVCAVVAATLVAAAPAAADERAVVLSADRAHGVARLAWGGEAHRVRARAIPADARFGQRVLISGPASARRLRVLGPARRLRVRGRVTSVHGRRRLRLGDRSLLRLARAHAAATQTIAAGGVSVSLEGFPVGLVLEVAIRFGTGGAAQVTIRPVTCCDVPEHPRIGDRFTVVGEYEPEDLEFWDDPKVTRDTVLPVGTQDLLDGIRRRVWSLPYPARDRPLVRRLRDGELVRVEGHLRAFDPATDPEDWEDYAERRGGIWAADRVVAIDPTVMQRPEQSPEDDDDLCADDPSACE